MEVSMMTVMFGFLAIMATLVLITCGIALVPAFMVIGMVMLAFGLVAGILGLIVRIVGALLLLALAVPLGLAMFGVVFAVGIALLHAALPLLLVVGIVWLIVHHNKRQQIPSVSRVA
jgi:hypothetical protein